MFFKDPANVFVVVVLVAFIGFVIAAKISSDKADKEVKLQKDAKEQSGKGKA